MGSVNFRLHPATTRQAAFIGVISSQVIVVAKSSPTDVNFEERDAAGQEI